MTLIISAAGSPKSTPKPGGSKEGIKQVAALGLKGIELEWVQRVPKNVEHLTNLKTVADDLQIARTVHAPYFVNLNAQSPEKLEASIGRVVDALAMAQVVGASSVCVHPAFYLGQDPKTVYANVHSAVERIMQGKQTLFPDVNLGLETMGKHTQFGTLEENLRISKDFNLYPVVDFAHIHARQNGVFNTADEWKQALELYAHYLGAERLGQVHFHYSGIEYTERGERRHLPFTESDANWVEFLQLLKSENIGGILVCESPLLEEDTLLLQSTYDSL